MGIEDQYVWLTFSLHRALLAHYYLGGDENIAYNITFSWWLQVNVRDKLITQYCSISFLDKGKILFDFYCLLGWCFSEMVESEGFFNWGHVQSLRGKETPSCNGECIFRQFSPSNKKLSGRPWFTLCSVLSLPATLGSSQRCWSLLVAQEGIQHNP